MARKKLKRVLSEGLVAFWGSSTAAHLVNHELFDVHLAGVVENYAGLVQDRARKIVRRREEFKTQVWLWESWVCNEGLVRVAGLARSDVLRADMNVWNYPMPPMHAALQRLFEEAPNAMNVFQRMLDTDAILDMEKPLKHSRNPAVETLRHPVPPLYVYRAEERISEFFERYDEALGRYEAALAKRKSRSRGV
jgi:hypothetical protein